MKVNNVLVTTTPTIDGVKIKKYIEPVSSHVVIGTNIFSDIFASLKDFFGGYSSSYQRKLKNIYEKATTKIKKLAYTKGANCILGLKVDISEVSGKNVSMLMITMTGTAAIIDMADFERNRLSFSTNNKLSLSADRFLYERDIKRLVEDVRNKKRNFNKKLWETIIEYKVAELLPEATKRVFSLLDDAESKELDLFQEYIKELDYSVVGEFIYELLLEKRSKKEMIFLIEILTDIRYLNLDYILTHLFTDDFEQSKKILQLIEVVPEEFTKEDIDKYVQISEKIDSFFQERGERNPHKSRWICECSTQNKEKAEYCKKCEKDIYGFFNYEISPLKAKKQIEETIEILCDYYKQKS